MLLERSQEPHGEQAWEAQGGRDKTRREQEINVVVKHIQLPCTVWHCAHHGAGRCGLDGFIEVCN